MENHRAKVALKAYRDAEKQTGIERTPASPFSVTCPIPAVSFRIRSLVRDMPCLQLFHKNLNMNCITTTLAKR